MHQPCRMKRFGVTLLTALLLMQAPVVIRAEEVAQLSPEQLVEQLGSRDFIEREQAADALMEQGLSAQAALDAGRRHVDREIRFRSARILAILQRTEFRRQLQAFLSDEKPQPELPGWKQFRESFEDTPDIRRLFVEMQQAEPELLAAVERGPRPAAEAINTRCEELQNARRQFQHQPDVGSVATLLFLAGEPEVNLQPIAAATIYSYCYQPAFRGAVSGGPQKNTLREMLGRWIKNGQAATPYQLLHLAMNYNLKEGVEPATQVLRDGSSAPHVRQYAILTIAKLGSKKHIPLIETLLDDQEPCGGSQKINNVVYQTRVCDVALATLVELAGENHQEFGFDERFDRNEQIAFNPSSLGFADEAKRAAAIGKWRAYRKRQSAEGAGEVKPKSGDDAAPSRNEKNEKSG